MTTSERTRAGLPTRARAPPLPLPPGSPACSVQARAAAWAEPSAGLNHGIRFRVTGSASPENQPVPAAAAARGPTGREGHQFSEGTGQGARAVAGRGRDRAQSEGPRGRERGRQEVVLRARGHAGACESAEPDSPTAAAPTTAPLSGLRKPPPSPPRTRSTRPGGGQSGPRQHNFRCAALWEAALARGPAALLPSALARGSRRKAARCSAEESGRE